MGFKNSDSINIINIEEEIDEHFKSIDLNGGIGIINGTLENNAKVYKVEFDVKYKEEGFGPKDIWIYQR